MDNGRKRGGIGDKAMIDVPWQLSESSLRQSTPIFRDTTNFLILEVELAPKRSSIRPAVLTELRRDTRRYTDEL